MDQKRRCCELLLTMQEAVCTSGTYARMDAPGAGGSHPSVRNVLNDVIQAGAQYARVRAGRTARPIMASSSFGACRHGCSNPPSEGSIGTLLNRLTTSS